jgi:chitin synthase
VPHEKGLLNFFEEFQRSPDVGGVCGTMGVRIEKEAPVKKIKSRGLEVCELAIYSFLEKIFSIPRAQQFEYGMAHILDKGFETVFGFIHVLPGAWSAYRWKALNDSSLLESKYLKSTNDNYEAKSIHEVIFFFFFLIDKNSKALPIYIL